MKKILIVGASGFIGANLAVFLRRHYRVYGTFHHHPPQIDDVPSVNFSLALNCPIRSFVKMIHPHVILYCASETDARKSEADPAKSEFLNSEAPYQFARAADEIGGRLVYLSSSKVFSGTEGNYDENSPLSPTTQYGRSKLRGEELLLAHCENACAVRLGTVFGLGSYFQHQAIITRLLKKFWRNEKSEFINDEMRSFISVHTLCQALKRLVDRETGRPSLFHLGGPEPQSYYSFAKKLLAGFNLPLELAVPVPGAKFAGADADFGGKRGNDLSLNSQLFSQTFSFAFPSTEESIAHLRSRLRLARW